MKGTSKMIFSFLFVSRMKQTYTLRPLRKHLRPLEVYPNNIHLFTKSHKCNEVKLAGGGRVRYAPASYATLHLRLFEYVITIQFLCGKKDVTAKGTKCYAKNAKYRFHGIFGIDHNKLMIFRGASMMSLFDSDLHELGQRADAERRRRHGNKAYYVVNAHINPTNVCRIGCPLCAFAATRGDKRAYVLTIDEMLQRAERAVGFGATQLHLVSSVHPDKPYAWYREITATLHQTFPQLWLKAWSAVEIAAFAHSMGKSYEFILSDLQSVGLSSLPGGGAEIFDAEVRKKIAPDKIPAEVWLEVHRTAHKRGIPTNAAMLFGHLETPKHRLEHLLKLRELQEATGGFDCFVPLVFHPKNTQIDVPSLSPQEILKTIAVCRLVLDNIEHIKAYWVTLGESLAQIALSYGADDFDGTVFEERIHHEAGSSTPSGLSEARLRELILGAGRKPQPITAPCALVPWDSVPWDSPNLGCEQKPEWSAAQ